MPASNKPSQWIVEPLRRHHDRDAFSCGNDTLDRYLKTLALQDARRHVAAPFVVVAHSTAKTVLGYYTLSSFGIDLADLPEVVVRKLPAYPVVPVTLLGRLAVDHRCHGQGVGEFLVMDALRRAFIQSAQIAAVAIVVEAIDDSAVRFYQHFGFRLFRDKPTRLFLPMKTIADLCRDTL
jgi:GNAT superfamily N-acetyltransferase